MRYFTRRPRAGLDYPRIADHVSDPLVPALEVSDHEPTFTGLIDKGGEEIWRAPRPIGFGRMEEW
jgi:hypothetical protein